MNKWMGLILFLSLGLVLTACASSGAPEPLEMTIDLSEFAFTPDHLEFTVGQEVTLHLINVGALDHEIMFGREVVMHDGQPAGYQTDMFEVAHVEPEVTVKEGAQNDTGEHESDEEHEEEHTGFMVDVPVGDDEYTIKFTVTEDMIGDWEIGCFDQNGVHYTAGMVGSLTVSP